MLPRNLDPKRVRLGVFMSSQGDNNRCNFVGFLYGKEYQARWYVGYLGEDDKGNDHGGRIFGIDIMDSLDMKNWMIAAELGNNRFGKWRQR